MGAHYRVELIRAPTTVPAMDDKSADYAAFLKSFPRRFNRKGEALACINDIANWGGVANLINLDKRKERGEPHTKRVMPPPAEAAE